MSNKYTLTLFILIITSCSTSKKKVHEVKYNNFIAEADSLYQHDNFNLAILKYDSLIKLFPTNGNFFYRLGYSYSLLLNYEQANKYYKEAIELNYRPGDAYHNMGINSSLNLNDSLAIIYFENALRHNQNDLTTIKEINLAKERISVVDSILEHSSQ